MERQPSTNDTNWLLVHDSDIGKMPFENMLSKQSGQSFPIKEIPWIRFTGGDPTGRPEDEHWVRYRLVSDSSPFTGEELTALDEWVRGGCLSDKRPWLLFEEKPHFLRGLLILLHVAEVVGWEDTVIGARKKGLEIESPKWWHDRLRREHDWDKALKAELSHRTSNPDRIKLLDDFIEWVNGSAADFRADELVAMLRECV